MIKKENKRVQITLCPDDLALLDSLKLRFHCNSTYIISQAIKHFAACIKSGKGHSFKVHLYIPPEVLSPEELEEKKRIASVKWLDDDITE